MSSDVAAWRALWRRRGLAVDRVLPKVFAVPAPTLDEVRGLVPKQVSLPTGSRESLQADDADVVPAFHTEASPAMVAS